MSTLKLPPLPERLRDAARELRTSSIPLADFIPLLQQAADAIALQGVPMAWNPTDDELTTIYKKSNGEDVGKAQPLTTQRIFKAMRAMLAYAPPAPQQKPLTDRIAELERQLEEARNHALEEAAKACDGVAYTHQNASMLGPEQNALKCAAAIRALKGAKE